MRNNEDVANALAMIGGLVLPEGNNFANLENWGTFECSKVIGSGSIAHNANTPEAFV